MLEKVFPLRVVAYSNEQAASMSFPRNSLAAFLSHAKTRLSECIRGQQNITIVIGNESAGKAHLVDLLSLFYLKYLMILARS